MAIKKRRVVITGIGLVSPLGKDRETTWSNLIEGQSGATKISQFDASNWSTDIACEVKNFDLDLESVNLEHRDYINRPTSFGLQAALEAMNDSKIEPLIGQQVARERFGISVGTGIGAINPHELSNMLRGIDLDYLDQDLGKYVSESTNTKMILRNHPGMLAPLLSARWNAKGPLSSIHTACASSGQSIGQAYLQVKRGSADVMLAGGADSLAGELLLAGFCLLGALSKRNDDPKKASRPFDEKRDGFVAGEGAGMLILEEFEHAKERGAKIYAEIGGYGETNSAYRITDLPPDGRGIVQAMQIAVEQSGLSTGQVDYINAHGTSTELNDRIEALAVERVFGDRAKNGLRMSSTKSSTGHLISAAGALELAFCCLAIDRNVAPPTLNLEKSNCSKVIDFVAQKSAHVEIDVCLSNSIGFGGSNSSILTKNVET